MSIKYTDLFAADVHHGLLELEDDAARLNQTFAELAKVIGNSRTRINISIKQQNEELKTLKATLTGVDVAGENAADTIVKISKAVEDGANKTRSYKTQQQGLNDVLEHAAGSYNDLQSRIKKLTAEYNKLGTATDSDKEKAKRLAEEVRRLKKEQDDLSAALKKTRQAVELAEGSYAQASKRLADLRKSLREMPGAINAETGAWNKANPAVRQHLKEIQKLDAALKKFDADMGNHQRNVGNYQGAIKSSISALASWATAYLSAGQALQYVFEKSLQFDAIRTSLEFSLGSIDLADAKMNTLKETADRLGIQYDALADSYKSFTGAAIASNYPLAESDKIFQAVANASSKMKLSSDQTKGALNALQQMISKGNVQAEELRGQLGERLPGAFAIAARAMGVSTSELGKMLERGEVLAVDLLPKLADELNKTFGADTTKKVGGLTAAWARFLNVFSEGVDENSRISGFFETVINGITGISSTIIKTINSTGWNEFWARLTSNKTADIIRNINQSYSAGSRALSNSGNLDIASADAKSIQTQYDAISAAYKRAKGAYDSYVSGVKNGVLSDEGERNIEQYGKLVDALGSKMSQLSMFLPKVNNVQKEAAMLTNEQLNSIAAIRKEITRLSKLEGSATKGSEVYNRIQELKAKLKELTPASRQAKEGFSLLEEQLKELGMAIEKGLLDGKLDEADKKLAEAYKKLEKRIEGLKKLRTSLLFQNNFTPSETSPAEITIADKVDKNAGVDREADNLQEIEKRYSEHYTNILEMYREGEITKSQYDVQAKQMEINRIHEVYFTEQNLINERLKIVKKGSREELRLRKEQADLEKQYQQDINDNFFESEEARRAVIAETLEIFKETSEIVRNHLGDGVASFFDAIVSDLERFNTAADWSAATFGEKFQSAADIAKAAMQSFTDYSLSASQSRIANLEKEKESEIRIAGDNKSAKQAIEDNYNQRVAAEKTKQARQAKLAAMFEIGINTAIAATKVTAQTGLFGLPLVPIIVGLGLAQLALVAAKPIPQFFKGTTYSPEGPAEVAERGPEIIEYPSGERRIATKRQVTYLPKGSKVFTHAQTQKMLERMRLEKESEVNGQLAVNMINNKRNHDVETMAMAFNMAKVDEYKIGKAVGDQILGIPMNNWSVDENGFTKYIRKRNTTIKNLNDRNSLK